MGQDVNELCLSLRKIGTSWLQNRKARAAEIKASLTTQTPLVLRRGGKLIMDLAGREKVDRLPILVSGDKCRKLLQLQGDRFKGYHRDTGWLGSAKQNQIFVIWCDGCQHRKSWWCVFILNSTPGDISFTYLAASHSGTSACICILCPGRPRSVQEPHYWICLIHSVISCQLRTYRIMQQMLQILKIETFLQTWTDESMQHTQHL